MNNEEFPERLVEPATENWDELTAHSPFNNILIYLDGSEASMEAIRIGIRIASAHGLPVTALYVLEEKMVEEIAAMTRDMPEVVLRQMEAKSRRYLEYAEQLANHQGVKCKQLVRRGIPHEQIMNVVRDTHIDLVVVGDYRVRGARRPVKGIFIERVIEYAPCSVLVVHPS